MGEEANGGGRGEGDVIVVSLIEEIWFPIRIIETESQNDKMCQNLITIGFGALDKTVLVLIVVCVKLIRITTKVVTSYW